MRGIAIVEATELSKFTNYAHILRSVYNHDGNSGPFVSTCSALLELRALTQELCKLQESEGNSSERSVQIHTYLVLGTV